MLEVSATATIHAGMQPVLYVAATSTNPHAYAERTTAASNIQDAVNAAPQGEGLVLVADGVYAGGLAIEKPLTVRAMLSALWQSTAAAPIAALL